MIRSCVCGEKGALWQGSWCVPSEFRARSTLRASASALSLLAQTHAPPTLRLPVVDAVRTGMAIAPSPHVVADSISHEGWRCSCRRPASRSRLRVLARSVVYFPPNHLTNTLSQFAHN